MQNLTVAVVPIRPDGPAPTLPEGEALEPCVLGGDKIGHVGRSRWRPLLLIDERPFMLDCLAGCLKANAREFSVLARTSVVEALTELQGTVRPDLIVLNVGILRVGNSRIGSHISRLSAESGGTPIVILSDLNEGGAAREALQLGARGYVSTAASLRVMVAALRLVLAGGTFIPETALNTAAGLQPEPVSRSDAEAFGRVMAEFTPREAEVLARLHWGKPNKVIAYELSLSESTIKVHVSRIMQKLRATNRAQVAYALSRLCGEVPLNG